MTEKLIEYLIVDTTAFIQNKQLQNIGKKIITIQEVINEITNKRQLRRLVALPYDLEVKTVFPENIAAVKDFSIKTGDYPCLSATDIKVMALTYQLEKEKVGIEHLRTEPLIKRQVNIISKKTPAEKVDMVGFYKGDDDSLEVEDKEDISTDEKSSDTDIFSSINTVNTNEEQLSPSENANQPLTEQSNVDNTDCENSFVTTDEIDIMDNILTKIEDCDIEDEYVDANSGDESDDDEGWITPSNVEKMKKNIDSKYIEEKEVKVACMTTDFSMQNVLKQMNLNVAALDGRLIKQLRTFILRCYTCFKTTSVMTKTFCPTCGNQTLKRVAVSLDENGKQIIHINGRKPLSARGKKFSLPTFKGGKHSCNPILVPDQPVPDNRPSRLARTKNNPLDDDWIAGYSPFVMRDVTSKSAMLGIRPDQEIKHWMRKNPNEARRKRK